MAYIELMMKLLKGKAFLLKIYILSGQNKDGKIKHSSVYSILSDYINIIHKP